MTKVTPFLMFNDQLEAAIEFYTRTFPRGWRGRTPGRSQVLVRERRAQGKGKAGPGEVPRSQTVRDLREIRKE